MEQSTKCNQKPYVSWLCHAVEHINIIQNKKSDSYILMCCMLNAGEFLQNSTARYHIGSSLATSMKEKSSQWLTISLSRPFRFIQVELEIYSLLLCFFFRSFKFSLSFPKSVFLSLHLHPPRSFFLLFSCCLLNPLLYRFRLSLLTALPLLMEYLKKERRKRIGKIACKFYVHRIMTEILHSCMQFLKQDLGMHY